MLRIICILLFSFISERGVFFIICIATISFVEFTLRNRRVKLLYSSNMDEHIVIAKIYSKSLYIG
jgi:hypothetical protein